jgi:hypothetical protein
MRPIRAVVAIFAWTLPLTALALIGGWTHRYYPGALGTVKMLLSRKPAQQSAVLWLGRFGSEAEAERWRRDGAELVAESGWGRVTFRKGPGLPGIRLTDYLSGPAHARDWSPYRRLSWEMRAPRETDRKLMMIVKDAGERRFERGFTLPGGQGGGRAVVDLEDMNPSIDLTRIGEIHFYIKDPDDDIVVELANVRLEKGGPPGEVLGKPFVVFDRLEAPPSARLGEAVTISAWLTITRPQTVPYSVFVHLYPEREKGVEVPAERAGYLHIENIPYLPVTDWPVGAPQQVGPFTVYFPKRNPTGRYLIRIGLYNALSGGNGPRDVPYRGAYDYAGSFPKCRYADPKIEDFVVGSIEVKENPASTQ